MPASAERPDIGRRQRAFGRTSTKNPNRRASIPRVILLATLGCSSLSLVPPIFFRLQQGALARSAYAQ